MSSFDDTCRRRLSPNQDSYRPVICQLLTRNLNHQPRQNSATPAITTLTTFFSIPAILWHTRCNGILRDEARRKRDKRRNRSTIRPPRYLRCNSVSRTAEGNRFTETADTEGFVERCSQRVCSRDPEIRHGGRIRRSTTASIRWLPHIGYGAHCVR